MKDSIKVEFIPAEKWWRRAKWRLLEDVTSDNEQVHVPEGFVTDGASIPYFARKVFPPTGKYFGAAIIHDWILKDKRDWDMANEQFKVQLVMSDIPKWRRIIVYGAVVFRGWLHKTGIFKSNFEVVN